MTVEDALKAFTAIAGLYDGTPESGERIVRLTRELIERPETFWERYFEVVNENPNDPIQQAAREFMSQRGKGGDAK